MKILQTFGISATPTQSTATWTGPAQQTTILDTSNFQYARNFILTTQGIRMVRSNVSAGIAFADLIQALVTLEPTLTWPPVITVQPTNASAVHSASATFSITATAEIVITYQWKINTNDGSGWSNVANSGPYAGATTNTLTFPNSTKVATLSGFLYQCVATNASGSATSSSAVLTVTDAPTITTQPLTKTVATGAATTFVVVAGNTPTGYQWAYNSGSGWSNLSNGGVYSTVTTSTLNISSVTGLTGYKFRCVVTNANDTTTSNAAVLTVV